MEPFLDRRLGTFLDDVADPAPIPGGGSAAAVAAAMAAGLLAMVARASLGSWPDAAGAAAQAEALRERIAPLADLTAAAYADALAVLGGDGGPADQERRDFRLGAALSRATAGPMSIAEAAADVAELGVLVADRGDPGRRADAVAAVVLADAAVRIAAELVRVSLIAPIDDDRVTRTARLAEATGVAAGRVLGES